MKTSKTKLTKKQIVIRVILVFIILNIIACPIITKIIYDSMFKRYDSKGIAVEAKFQPLIDLRQEKKFMSGDNELFGYFYDIKESDYECDNSGNNTLVVIVPGMNAHMDEYLPQVRAFADEGFGVFIFDPTGNCYSEGKSTIGFEQELLDLDNALNYIEDNGNFGYEKIALFGHSRGGYAATAVPLFDHDIAAIVSVGGINSAMEGIMEPAVGLMGKFAYFNYPMLYLYNVILFGKDYVDANAVDAMASCSVPTLVIHGSEDERIAVDEYSTYSHKDEIEATDDNNEVDYILATEEGCNGHSDTLRNYEGEANKALMDEIVEFICSNV